MQTNTKHRGLVAVVVGLALVGAACSHGATSPRTASAGVSDTTSDQASSGETRGMGSAMMAEMCPAAVPGTQVVPSDTGSGEALTFSTTSRDQVSELRRRVHAMADMHNNHHASGAPGGMDGHGHGGSMMGGGMGSGGEMHHAMPPPSTAAVEDTDSGARLVLTPKDPAQLAQLRSAVRSHAEMMRQGRCAMMGGAGMAH